MSELLTVLKLLTENGTPSTDVLTKLPEEEREIIRKLASFIQEVQVSREQIMDANRLRDEFLANISHEVHTPLTSIIGFSRLLLDFPDMDPQERLSYLNIIHDRAQVLGSLLSDLLDISRIESNNMPLEIENINLGSLINQCTEQLRLMAESKGIRLSSHLDHGTVQAFGDRKLLSQLLHNLIHNALKFTDSGGTVDILGKQLPHEVMVSVVDTGIGIDKSKHTVIFERFRQIRDRNLHAGGAGIGLNLAKLIVELHGGKIWMESEPNKGSSFSFCIPRKKLCRMNGPKKVRPLFE